MKPSVDKVWLMTETGYVNNIVAKNPGDPVLMTLEQLKCKSIPDDGKTATAPYWWLRSPRRAPSTAQNRAGIVHFNGTPLDYAAINDTYLGVRPAVTVDLR